ncbi:hypothetical protein FALBO_4057 [Fusarium albosuccineum]|uniref:Uncharacterized protein n=1 Tax=Fusarium albosuccineum TaxID=1237068 RepID=A0A8H4LIL9_9HYPO|nr:hypothetical protein FALBO_4057 [Fusarium albosuccineum]
MRNADAKISERPNAIGDKQRQVRSRGAGDDNDHDDERKEAAGLRARLAPLMSEEFRRLNQVESVNPNRDLRPDPEGPKITHQAAVSYSHTISGLNLILVWPS